MSTRWTMLAVGLCVISHGSLTRADTVGDLRVTPTTPRIATNTPVVEKPQPQAKPPTDVTIDHSPLDESRAVAVQESVVRFAEELDLPSTESGLIAESNMAVGDKLKWGDSIARLDDRAMRIRSRAANLRLESAMQQVGDDLEMQYAEKALQESQAELDASRAIYNDAAGAIPMTTIRRLRLSVERAELEVARAKKAAEIAKIEVNLRAADVSSIDETMRRLQLQSPLTGVVLQVYRRRGEWVTAGEPVVRVARLDRLEVHALLTADQVSPQDCRDQPVSVRWTDPLTQAEHELRGRVTAVNPQRLAGSRYRIGATIQNERIAGDQDWLLHPGTEVRMHVYPRAVAK